MASNFKNTITGFLSGFTCTGVFLQVDPMTGSSFGVKLIVAVVIAFFGGIAGVAGKEFYTWVKSKINKNKDNASS